MVSLYTIYIDNSLQTPNINVSLTKSRYFIVSHIFREGNSFGYKLASYWASGDCYTWWDLIPSFISEDFYHNRYGLPLLRFFVAIISFLKHT